jgi:hypothetical protein
MDNKKTLILVAGGIGDCILGFQCAHFVKQAKKAVDVVVCSRKEVFIPLEYLFWQDFNVKHHPEHSKWGDDNWILKNQKEICAYEDEHPEYDEIYYVVPDLLYRNEGAFNFKKYNTHPQIIKSTRLLTNRRSLSKDNQYIYCALTSSTPGYSYHDTPKLLSELGERLTSKTIYFPKVNSWAGTNITYGNLDKLPSNVHIDNDPDIIDSIQIMQQSEYVICLDNGLSHIAWHLGIPRLLLDSRYGFTRNCNPWTVRWKEDLLESIVLQCPPEQIADLVELNLRIPQTTLLPRQFVLNNLKMDWKSELLLK